MLRRLFLIALLLAAPDGRAVVVERKPNLIMICYLGGLGVAPSLGALAIGGDCVLKDRFGNNRIADAVVVHGGMGP